MHHLKIVQQINDTFADETKFLYIAMPMYNLIEYSSKYSDTSGSLWQFKTDKVENYVNVTVANSSSFKYKSDYVGNTGANGTKSRVK